MRDPKILCGISKSGLSEERAQGHDLQGVRMNDLNTESQVAQASKARELAQEKPVFCILSGNSKG